MNQRSGAIISRVPEESKRNQEALPGQIPTYSRLTFNPKNMKKSLLVCLTMLVATLQAAQRVIDEKLALSSRPAPSEKTFQPKTLAPGYPVSYGGSHRYEYISAIEITQLNPSNLRLVSESSWQIQLGTQQPYPEYDNSPEYVNAWIDWNGDKQWTSSECVMAQAGTGYAAISYAGEMVFSTVVSIPPDATAEATYCRVMLGWI